VLEAGDGQAALDLLARNPDRLPASSSSTPRWPRWTVGAVAAIRADPALAHLPVVMVTASLQQQEKERSIAAGVDAFVAKPFEPEDLVDLVSELAASGRPHAQP
jgi:CheY-like chemotaxis protein